MYTFVHFCASLLSIMRCIRSHISLFRLGLTPTLRGNCTPNQKIACFVLYLKIINNFLRNSKEVAESRTAGFSYGMQHVFIVIQWTMSHSSLNDESQWKRTIRRRLVIDVICRSIQWREGPFKCVQKTTIFPNRWLRVYPNTRLWAIVKLIKKHRFFV